MPIFKFSGTVNGGTLQLPGISVYGENTEIPFYGSGDVVISLSVYGESDLVVGTGTVEVFDLSIAGQSEAVVGTGDIAIPVIELYGSDGVALGEIFNIPFYSIISVDGYGILNGVCNGEITVSCVSVAGRQALKAEIIIPLLRIFGTGKQSVVDLLASSIYLPVVSVAGYGVQQLVGSCEILLDIAITGNGVLTKTGIASAEIPITVSIHGRGRKYVALSFNETDVVLKYDNSRRLI